MSLVGREVEEISESDLDALIQNGVSEGLHYEYKSQLYGNSNSEKKEFLKDVSSLANTQGGHLLIGMNEVDGVATELAPITGRSMDTELLRLESLLQDGLEPRIVGCRPVAINLSGGGFAIVLRVPRSWNPPHRVNAYGTNRFYVRNSRGVHEPSVEELRVLFNATASMHERIRAYRIERLSEIRAGTTPVPLAVSGDGILVLHLVPFSSLAGGTQVDLEATQRQEMSFAPLGVSHGFNRTINFDGFVCSRTGPNCHGYTQLFRNGIVEATKVGAVGEVNGQPLLPGHAIAKIVADRLTHYLNMLDALGVAAPVVAMVSLLDVRGARMRMGAGFMADDSEEIAQQDLLLPEVLIENYGDDRQNALALRPAFDALWNAGGYAKADIYTEEGDFIHP